MITTLALAFHPGHGTTEPSGLLHYLTEPVHVVALATVVTVVAVSANVVRRSVAHSARSRQR